MSKTINCQIKVFFIYLYQLPNIAWLKLWLCVWGIGFPLRTKERFVDDCSRSINDYYLPKDKKNEHNLKAKHCQIKILYAYQLPNISWLKLWLCVWGIGLPLRTKEHFYDDGQKYSRLRCLLNVWSGSILQFR